MSADENRDIRDNEEAQRLRLLRDLALTPSERLVELDELLRAAAALQALPRKPAT